MNQDSRSSIADSSAGVEKGELKPETASIPGASTVSSSTPLEKDSTRPAEVFPRPATAEEIRDLPHVRSRIPKNTWLLVFIGSATSFARYGVTTPFQNYLQNPPGNPHLPGALGLGQSTGTITTSAVMVYFCVTPLPMSIFSDAYLGRYRTMLISLFLLLVGYILQVLTAMPIALQHGAGLCGLIVAMVFVGLGQGGISAVIFAFIADQIPDAELSTTQTSKKKLVVISHKVTIQFIFNVYFWASNVASLSVISSTLMERVSFWSSFLVPTGLLAISVVPLLVWSSRLIKPPLQENVLPQTLKILFMACRKGFRLSAVPSNCQLDNALEDSSFIDELRRGLRACQVMGIFAIYWLCYNQVWNNIISQAGQMELHGISNDTMVFLEIVAVVVLGPVIQGLAGLLQWYHIPFGPVRRMTAGFVLITLAMAYAAGLQHLIYSRGPCYSYPLDCPAAYEDGRRRPNSVNVWIQTPIHFLLGGSEILGYVSMTEYAYAEAPANMKAVIQALCQLAIAIGSALGIALGPVSKDPWLVILYGSLAGVMGLSTVIFWVVFRKRDDAYVKASVI